MTGTVQTYVPRQPGVIWQMSGSGAGSRLKVTCSCAEACLTGRVVTSSPHCRAFHEGKWQCLQGPKVPTQW